LGKKFGSEENIRKQKSVHFDKRAKVGIHKEVEEASFFGVLKNKHSEFNSWQRRARSFSLFKNYFCFTRK
jgi:hypothetical protein